MENVNKQLLDLISSVLECEIEASLFEQHVVPALNVARKVAAEKVQQVEPSQEWIEYLIEDVSAIDCMYRGDPMYEHDAYWMKDRVIKMLEKRRDAAGPTVVPVPTIKLGLYGRAFDAPQTRRAYTYQHQPDNVGAYNLGRAAASTSPGGDSIDRGLSLLKELQAHGFGVFELGDQQEGGQ